MEGKKISVIIPVYNIQDYLSKCVDSILNQTYKNIQVILVDDGSKDSSPQICDSYKEKDSRVVVIHKENGGVSSARNVGVERADGDYITFVDSDDYLEPDTYKKLLEAAETYSLDVTACGYFITDAPQELPEVEGVSVLERKEALSYCISDDAGSTMCGAVWNKLYRADKLKDCLVFNSEYIIAEDMVVTIRCLMGAERIGQVNWCGYHYVQRGDSIINSFKEKKSSSVFAHQEMYEELKNIYPDLAKDMKVRSLEQSYYLLLEAVRTEGFYKKDITVLKMDIKKNRGYLKMSQHITGKNRCLAFLMTSVPGAISLLRCVYKWMKK